VTEAIVDPEAIRVWLAVSDGQPRTLPSPDSSESAIGSFRDSFPVCPLVLGRAGGGETRREITMTTTQQPEPFAPIVESLVKLDITPEELQDAQEVAGPAELPGGTST
jgi:hypothetical protein